MMTPTPVGITANIAKFGIGIAVQGLAFNVRAIKNIAEKALKGQLLENVTLKVDPIAKAITTYLSSEKDLSGIQLSNLFVKGVITTMLSLFTEEIGGIHTLATALLHFFQSDQFRTQEKQIFEQLTYNTTSHLAEVVCTSFNSYFALLANDSQITTQQQGFLEIFERFVYESDPTKKEALRGQLLTSFVELKSCIDAYMDKAYGHSTQQSREIIDAISSKITEVFSNERKVKLITSQLCLGIANGLLEINKLTKPNIGIELFGTESIEYMMFFMMLHYENLIKAIVNNLVSEQKPKDSKEIMKEFRFSCACILADALRISIGKEAASPVASLIKTQL
jgi:hypothetical protein